MGLILAGPLVLGLPGAALLRLFPGRLPAPGRYALTAGLSMAVCLLGGLLLDAVGALTTPGWFVCSAHLIGWRLAPHVLMRRSRSPGLGWLCGRAMACWSLRHLRR